MTIHFQETLYKVHSTGQIGSWGIYVEGSEQDALMTTVSRKVLDGAPVTTPRRITEGKNIGRANETTPLEQAIAEARSKVAQKIDKGYVREIPKAGEKATNGLGFIKPMLAQPIDKVKNWDYPVYVQPKFDGHRMLATVQDGNVVLYSRQGKVVDVEHIRSELQKLYDKKQWDGATLDGEVYCHGETLQRISSWVKKPKPESEQLGYYLYDIDLDTCYSSRLPKLNYFSSLLDVPHIKVTPTLRIDSHDELEKFHAECIGHDYEGTIVRQKGIGYEADKRSKSLMKKKDFQDAEFEIISAGLGKPNERLGLQVGIYTCRTPDGKEFSVLAPGDASDKDAHAKTGSKNIGRYLTVKFFNYTPDGIPFHPVALRVREDI
jgi:DNA ligase-1